MDASSKSLNPVCEAVFGSILLSGIIFLFQWSYGFGLGDEGHLWYVSQRTSLGEVPLRDFFSYDPGRYYWNSLFFYLADDSGLRTLILSGSAFGAMGLAAIWFSMCKAGVSVHWRFACALLVAFAIGFPRHKVYEESLSLILCAVIFWVLLNPRELKRWFIFGCITGLAAFIGRNHGLFFVYSVILCIACLWVAGQRGLVVSAFTLFSGGVVIGYMPMIGFIVFVPGFSEAFIQSVIDVFQLQISLPIPFVWTIDFSEALSITFIQKVSIGILCVLVPLFYVIGLALFVLKTHGENTNRIIIFCGACCIAGISYLHQAFERADTNHILQATLPIYPVVFSLAYYLWGVNRFRRVSGAGLFLSIAIILTGSIPSQPWVKFNVVSTYNPNSVTQVSIGGRLFFVKAYQAKLFAAIEEVSQVCEIASDDFLAAPHFPGVYALRGSKAPFWEIYYLYQRAPEFQQRHIAAIKDVRLILLAPDATVDGLEHLKLKNSYGLLMKYIDENFEALEVTDLPSWAKLYVPLRACPQMPRLES